MAGRRAVLTIATVALVIGGTAPLAATADTTASAGGWTVVSSPNVNSDAHHLSAVSAESATDAWAVGHYRNSAMQFQTLTERWNGAVWSVVASPNVGSGYNFLSGVTAIAPTDVWAVGYYLTATFESRPLIQHWNGIRWSVIASPNPGAGEYRLSAVTAVSSTDVWAVGGGPRPLIEHWNGTAWSIASLPAVTGDTATLFGVAARSGSSVWAVGETTLGYGAVDALALQWNGHSWAIHPTPDVDSSLTGVVATSGKAVWSVGGQGRSTRTLAERWTPSAWRMAATPTPTTSSLTGVAARSGTDVWAVGTEYLTPGTLIEHWNGVRWAASPSPRVGLASPLSGVAAAPDGTLWAVGGFYPGSGLQEQTLILRGPATG